MSCRMVQRECNPGRQTDMKFVLGMLILLTLSVLNTQAQGLGERCEDKCSDPDAECKESRSSGIYSCVCKNTSTDQHCEASQDEKACGGKHLSVVLLGIAKQTLHPYNYL